MPKPIQRGRHPINTSEIYLVQVLEKISKRPPGASPFAPAWEVLALTGSPHRVCGSRPTIMTPLSVKLHSGSSAPACVHCEAVIARSLATSACKGGTPVCCSVRCYPAGSPMRLDCAPWWPPLLLHSQCKKSSRWARSHGVFHRSAIV